MNGPIAALKERYAKRYSEARACTELCRLRNNSFDTVILFRKLGNTIGKGRKDSTELGYFWSVGRIFIRFLMVSLPYKQRAFIIYDNDVSAF